MPVAYFAVNGNLKAWDSCEIGGSNALRFCCFRLCRFTSISPGMLESVLEHEVVLDNAGRIGVMSMPLWANEM